MKSKSTLNKNYLSLFVFFLFSSLTAWSRSNNVKRPTSDNISWGNVQINAYPANNPILDVFHLYQANLNGLSCYIVHDNRSYDVHGKDSNGDTIISSHYTFRYSSSGYTSSRGERDSVYTANTVLRRYIQAGICSGSKSKFYKVGNCEESVTPERCRPVQSESEFW